MLRNCLVISLCFIITVLHARTIPVNNDTLNYRIVPFIVDSSAKYKNYQLEIAKGHFTNEKEFEHNLFLSSRSKNGQWVEEVPLWGEQYTWRVIYSGKRRKESSFKEEEKGTRAQHDDITR